MGINGYTPVPGTLGDVGQRTKKVIVDSSKNIHLCAPDRRIIR